MTNPHSLISLNPLKMPGLVVYIVLLLSLVAPGLQQEDKEDGLKKDCSKQVFCIPDSYDVSHDDNDYV